MSVGALGLIALHVLFFTPFVVRFLVSGGFRGGPARAVAPGARGLLVFHALGLGVMYFGVGWAFGNGEPRSLGRLPGGALALLGAGLATWTLVAFRSWRLRAEIAQQHELEVHGPFALVRHPIYLAMDLLALGTALWLPHPVVWLGAALVAIGGDRRARAEEKVLLEAFGERYRAYCGHVPRFVPGVY